MKLVIILLLCVLGGYLYLPKAVYKTTPQQIVDTIPKNAKILIDSYPEFVEGYANNYIIFKDKSKLIWDDGIKNKPFQQLLDHPDLKDLFIQKYVKGRLSSPPSTNFDPGRVRNEALFLKIYGNTEAVVRKNLTTITWCPKNSGQQIRVTTVNGIDKKLIQISNELDQHPELKKYLTDIGGTFTWRNIKGTTRHSMHSFGMTIDINTNYSAYWEWDCKCTDENATLKYRNKIPQLIVDTFEKYGFIWGGKWYHYDTMHFEYRPEIMK